MQMYLNLINNAGITGVFVTAIVATLFYVFAYFVLQYLF